MDKPAANIEGIQGVANQLKFFTVCGFYLGSNLLVVWLPLLVYFAYRGSWLCRLFWLVVIIDYAIPLKLPGLWLRWCILTDDVAGKRSYFDLEIVQEGELQKDKNYLVGFSPHSLFGIAYNALTKHLYEKYGIIGLFTGAEVVSYLPLLRRALCWWGYTSVSAKPMKKNLSHPYPHNVLTLLPGGIAEMFYGIDEEQIILSKRKGFCKIALQTGASLIPCYTLGANQIYNRYWGPDSFMAKLSSKIQTSLVFWTDRFGIPFGIIPNKVKIILLIGKPIDVPVVAEPTREQVESLHSQYVAELRGLFDRHKVKMGPEWSAKHLYFEDESTSKKKN